MKKKINILGLAAMAALFFCCQSEKEISPNLATRGLLELSLSSVVASGNSEEIHTVRFIIFDDASFAPKLDLNEFRDLGADSEEATKFTALLEASVNDDKMVFVIVNEPAALKTTLNGITSPAELAGLEYTFAQTLNGPYTLKDTGIPMTGVKRDVVVKGENESPITASRVTMYIERVVARVDLYLKVTEAGAKTGYDGTTVVTLENTYHTGNLVMGNAGNQTRDNITAAKNFGAVPTVSSANLSATPTLWKTWTGTSDETIEYVSGQSNTLYVCSFYTPERTCATDAERLKLVLDNVKKSAGGVFARQELLLKTFTDENGSPAELNTIRRNYVYRIVGTVGAPTEPILFGGITVSGWGPVQNIDTPLVD